MTQYLCLFGLECFSLSDLDSGNPGNPIMGEVYLDWTIPAFTLQYHILLEPN